MAVYREELSVLDELENAFYILTEKCWLVLGLAILVLTCVQLAAVVVNFAWGTEFEPGLPTPIRAWSVAFMLGSGWSLIIENRDQFSGARSRTFWWLPFASVLAALCVYLMI